MQLAGSCSCFDTTGRNSTWRTQRATGSAFAVSASAGRRVLTCLGGLPASSNRATLPAGGFSECLKDSSGSDPPQELLADGVALHAAVGRAHVPERPP